MQRESIRPTIVTVVVLLGVSSAAGITASYSLTNSMNRARSPLQVAKSLPIEQQQQQRLQLNEETEISSGPALVFRDMPLSNEISKYGHGAGVGTSRTYSSLRDNAYSRNSKQMPNLATNKLTEALSDVAMCKNFPGLTKKQIELCYRFPDVMITAMQGFQVAVTECQYQFQKHRWNCSSLQPKIQNPHTSVLLQKGYRETAFAYAISSAGVAAAVAKACSQGKLTSCTCDAHLSPRGKRRRYNQKKKNWKWSGCSHNIDFGIKFSQYLLDAREKAKDIHSQINLHNNQAGRMVVARNMEVKCKCHGLSGSCEMKTCWKSAPDFRHVGQILKKRFDYALQLQLDNPHIANRAQAYPLHKYLRTLSDTDLVYYERSPSFCETKPDVDFYGVSGRHCNRSSQDIDGCDSLCCGRGYNMIRQRRMERCQCRFHWCCYVVCNNCTVDEWITVCK